jgi:hypothetical protein
VSTRWIVTHDLTQWKNEITWMSLYFSAALWASPALCVFYSFQHHLAGCRTLATVASCVVEPHALIHRSRGYVRRQRDLKDRALSNTR